MASMHVLYHQWPGEGRPFIMTRRWGTWEGNHGEIVAEYGYVTDEDELETRAHLLPHWYGLEEALTFVKSQLASLQ